MKKVLLTLSAMIAMSVGAGAQIVNIEPVDVVTDDVQLEVITPAEPVKETKKEKKEREKRLREFNDDVAFAKAANSLKRGYFVVLAEYIQRGRSGFRNYAINPNANFLLVQDEDGIIQYAFNRTRPGTNGLGGWTGKGTVRNKKITTSKNGDVHLQFHIAGKSTNSDVRVTLYHNSKYGEVRIWGDVNLVMYGEIRPYRDNDHR